jgi:hypothetical protein
MAYGLRGVIRGDPSAWFAHKSFFLRPFAQSRAQQKKKLGIRPQPPSEARSAPQHTLHLH